MEGGRYSNYWRLLAHLLHEEDSREPDEYRKQDKTQDHGKNAQPQRADHFHRQLIGALLSPQQPTVTHFVAEDTQGLGHIGAKLDRLAQNGDEGARLVDAEPVRKGSQGINGAAASAQLSPHDLQIST